MFWIILAVVGLVFAVWFLLRKDEEIDKESYRPFKLVRKDQVTHNTRNLRFALSSEHRKLNLPIGKHLKLRAFVDGSEVIRSYTPVSKHTQEGYFELVVKVYRDGKMSRYLDAMKVGDCIDVKGPVGHLEYLGKGRFVVKDRHGSRQIKVDRVCMVAGGTGITPMFQITLGILNNVSDRTEVDLIFANVTEEDILMRDRLDKMAEKYSNFRVVYSLDQLPYGWRGEEGFVSVEMMKKYFKFDQNCMLMVCGPPPMIKAMKNHVKEMNLDSARFFAF